MLSATSTTATICSRPSTGTLPQTAGSAGRGEIDHDQMSIRKRFLDLDEEHGPVVIDGHPISPEPQLRHNRIGIDIGAYASDVFLVLDGDRRAFLQTIADRQ
jgi:hypothetical protein